MPIQDLSLDLINLYGGTQTRVATNDDAVAAYAEEMAHGAAFPPVTVYFDGSTHWLADGFHRYLAAKRNQQPTLSADVQPGGRTDALRHALGANATNGLYRTNGDKRHAAEIALEEWPEMANPVLAEICHVSIELVRRARADLIKLNRIEAPERVTGRDGRDYPATIERQPRGKTEKTSAEENGGGGRGSSRSAGKANESAPGGASMEIEREARAMIRRGEVNPFELPTLLSANAHDYAAAVINLLGTMKPHDPKRQEGLLRIKTWVEKALAGELPAPELEESEVA